MQNPLKIARELFEAGNYAIPIIGAFVLSLFLLLDRTPGGSSEYLNTYFIPALAVYVIGAGIISYAHRLHYLLNKDENGKVQDLPVETNNKFIYMHALLLIAFAAYSYLHI